jgi:uncharacterized membrane protein
MSPPLNRRTLAGGAIVALLTAVSAVAYPDLPERMAIHFDAAGQPDSYLARPYAVAVGPVAGLGALVLFQVLPRLDPLGENVAGFQRYYDLLAVVTVGVLAYVHGLVLAYNLGYRFDVATLVVPVVAVTFVVAGYVIENAKQNWFVGIRTPWTLSDEEVWTATHERTGVLFKLAGLVALSALVFPEYLTLLLVGPAAAVALFGTVYSYVVYRRKSRDRAEPG